MSKRANPPPLSRALVQDNVPAQVMEGLWIGSIHAAFNQDSMQDRGITHVLNASGLPATFPRQFTYFTVDIRDKEHANILSAIAAVNIFIEAGVQKGGVLVHCAGGRSRSAAFVAAFIMSTQGCGFDPAFAQVRRARPVASLNRGFEQQLRAYGAAQCDVFVASQMMLRIRAAALLDRRNLLLLRRNSNASAEGALGGGGAGSGTGGSAVAEQTKLPPPMPSPQHQTSSLTSTAGARGIPPTPRSPRGRGRSPAGGSPAMRWQHKNIGGGSTVGGAVTAGSAEAAAAAAGAVAAGGGLGLGKIRDDQIIFLPKELRPARLRLCRPGSASMQVIPPLKVLEQIYACRGCGAFLLTGGHVINLDMDLPSIHVILGPAASRNQGDQHHQHGSDQHLGNSPRSLFPSNSTAGVPSCSTKCYAVRSTGDSGKCGGSTGTGGTLGTGMGGDRRSTITTECYGPSRSTPTCSASSTSRLSSVISPPLLGTTLTPMDLVSERSTPPIQSRVNEDVSISEALPVGEAGARVAEGNPSRSGRAEAVNDSQTTVGHGGSSTDEGGRSQSSVAVTPSPCRRRPWRAALKGSVDSVDGETRGRGGARGAGRQAIGSDRRRAGGQGKNVFVFESEDDASNVDPSEADMILSDTSPLAMDSFNSGSGVGSISVAGGGSVGRGSEGNGGGGGAWSSSWGSGVGGRRRRGRRQSQSGNNSSVNAPGAPSQNSEFSLALSSKVSSSMGSGMESVSPVVTPRSPRTPASCGSSSPCASDASFSTPTGRPLSAEKRQYLMRMQLMESSRMVSGSSSASYPPVEAESQVERLNSSRSGGRWLHVDLLEWMGDIMAAPTGRIVCPNPTCGVELGSWTWEKSDAVAAKAPTGPPLIRLEKPLIKPTSYVLSNLESRSGLSRDNTPRSSPTSASTSTASSSSASTATSMTLVGSKTAAPEAAATRDPRDRDHHILRLSSARLESRLAGLSTVLLRRTHHHQRQQQALGSPPE